MPYIKKELRPELDELVEELIGYLNYKYILKQEIDDKDLASMLTYFIFKVMKHFYEKGRWYQKADVAKICNSVVDEFNRRFMHPYEDQKIKENGDVV
jgi:hypothetical protein